MAATPRVLTGNTTLFSTATQIYTVNKPTGIVDGDFVLVQFGINNTAAGSFTTVPSGWVPLFTTNPYWLTPSNTIAAFYKFASNEPSTWNFVYSAVAGAPGSAIVFAASGVDTTNPINVLSAMSTGGSATHIAPGVTTTVANCIQIAGAIHQSGTTQDLASPAGWTEVGSTYVDGATAAGRIGAIAHNGNVALGATSTATFTGTQALTGIAWQAALTPSSGGQILTQTFTDTIGITDASIKFGYSNTIIDNMGVNDTLTPILNSAQSQTFIDSVGTTDANLEFVYSKVVTDSISISDILTPTLTSGAGQTLTFSDSMGLVESISRSLNARYNFIDNSGLVDPTPSISITSSTSTKFIAGNIETPGNVKFITANTEVPTTITRA